MAKATGEGGKKATLLRRIVKTVSSLKIHIWLKSRGPTKELEPYFA